MTFENFVLPTWLQFKFRFEFCAGASKPSVNMKYQLK